MRRYKHLDVEWRLPNRKRPFAYSTTATSDLIALLSQEYTTIQEVYDHIYFDREAKAILKVYIEKGYGNEIAANHFRYRGRKFKCKGT